MLEKGDSVHKEGHSAAEKSTDKTDGEFPSGSILGTTDGPKEQIGLNNLLSKTGGKFKETDSQLGPTDIPLGTTDAKSGFKERLRATEKAEIGQPGEEIQKAFYERARDMVINLKDRVVEYRAHLEHAKLNDTIKEDLGKILDDTDLLLKCLRSNLWLLTRGATKSDDCARIFMLSSFYLGEVVRATQDILAQHPDAFANERSETEPAAAIPSKLQKWLRTLGIDVTRLSFGRLPLKELTLKGQAGLVIAGASIEIKLGL